MNVENMKKLITRLEEDDPKVGFNMSNWFNHNGQEILGIRDAYYVAETHACGTVACIAGHAALLATEEDTRFMVSNEHVEKVARDWLELEEEEAFHLFQGHGWIKTCVLEDVTKTKAIDHLKELVEQGFIQ